MKTSALRKYVILSVLTGFIFWVSFPDKLFTDPLSVVVYDREEGLLGARIASDGQWRFPEPDSIPSHFKTCITLFEDRYFSLHPGVNPVSLVRAAVQNLKKGEIVSGASTLSMQVIRLSRKNKARTLREKLIEIFLSLQLELRYSKEEILKMYAGNAPFGGNIVGLEAASHRYFNRSPFDLSLSESALLAVLPNAPSLIHPGRNRQLLKEKRNRLLDKLYQNSLIDSFELKIYKNESIPQFPERLPDESYHLIERIKQEFGTGKIRTGIDPFLQGRINVILNNHKRHLYANGITNAACLVVSVESGEVLAYVGNLRNETRPGYGGDVDIIPSYRSTGSILKPLLFASMLYRGEILPGTLVPDIPSRYGNYSPKNFDRGYSGVVPASEAITRSLNVPAVRMLNRYGTDRFYMDLKRMGIKSLTNPPEHYGLSLILGGAETSLWELTGVYSSMARVLNNYSRHNGSYFRSDWKEPELLRSTTIQRGIAEEQGLLGAGSVWLCFQALRELKRPDMESGWRNFTSSRTLAWKTGTSFGFRDAWAIGVTPDFVVAVWTGNASGEGRPGLTGLTTSAPLMFDVFNTLPSTGWFDVPYDDLRRIAVCNKSGYRAGRYCETDTILVPPSGVNGSICPYHQRIHLSQDENYRVFADCAEEGKMVSKNWFVLPPAEEWYYKQEDINYRELPDLHPSCKPIDNIQQVQVIYPDPGSRIYIPYEYDGNKGRVVFEATHRKSASSLYWSVDDEYKGKTTRFHKMEMIIPGGDHILTLTDEDGNQARVAFTILEKDLQ